ncbi:hypothetical protein HPB51_005207 [Rhipicephalus microplus]|uniref:Uncharacterized protein n=1 Tax=Rhipicephalus microplus TaxID=6941 RepID=A0A9J6E716_RHIMP|nr:hypothetical protein HPB51_005207 [Rhipicephalus microplus]
MSRQLRYSIMEVNQDLYEPGAHLFAQDGIHYGGATGRRVGNRMGHQATAFFRGTESPEANSVAKDCSKGAQIFKPQGIPPETRQWEMSNILSNILDIATQRTTASQALASSRKAFPRLLVGPVLPSSECGQSLCVSRRSGALEMVGLSMYDFYGCCLRSNRPRVSDATAEKILERIAEQETSDLDFSDSDDDSGEDFVFTSSVLHNELSSEDEDTMNEGSPVASSSTSTSFGAQRPSCWKKTER